MTEFTLSIVFGGFTVAVIVISLEMWRAKIAARKLSRICAMQRRARSKCGEIMGLLLNGNKEAAMAKIGQLGKIENGKEER